MSANAPGESLNQHESKVGAATGETITSSKGWGYSRLINGELRQVLLIKKTKSTIFQGVIKYDRPP